MAAAELDDDAPSTRSTRTDKLWAEGHWTIQLRNHGDFEGEAANQPGNAELRALDAPRFDRAGAVYFPLWSIGRNRSPSGWCRLIRISRQIAIFENDCLQMIAVVAHEPVAPAIEAHPMLPAAGGGNNFTRARVEGEVAATQLERATCERRRVDLRGRRCGRADEDLSGACL